MIEIRDPDDEIVAKNCSVHIERMDNGYVWVGITEPDGGLVHVDLVMGPKCHHKIRMRVRDERGEK